MQDGQRWRRRLRFLIALSLDWKTVQMLASLPLLTWLRSLHEVSQNGRAASSAPRPDCYVPFAAQCLLPVQTGSLAWHHLFQLRPCCLQMRVLALAVQRWLARAH